MNEKTEGEKFTQTGMRRRGGKKKRQVRLGQFSIYQRRQPGYSLKGSMSSFDPAAVSV